jgi:hypothetical protein
MKKMRTKTKLTRIGSSLLIVAGTLLLSTSVAFAAKKDKPKAAPPAFALIAGTVYRPPGFALPGVEVKLQPEQSEVNGVKLKKIDTATDARGEWAVRVPPVPSKWRVDVKVSGYRAEQRTVSVEGEQRVDLSIILDPSGGPPKEAKQ